MLVLTAIWLQKKETKIKFSTACIHQNLKYIRSCLKFGKNCSCMVLQLLFLRKQLGVSVLLVDWLLGLVRQGYGWCQSLEQISCWWGWHTPFFMVKINIFEVIGWHLCDAEVLKPICLFSLLLSLTLPSISINLPHIVSICSVSTSP